MRPRQLGATGLLILVILVLVAIAVLATAFVSRIGSAATDLDNTIASLGKAAAALDAFAGASGRLPCPADPTLDAGVEVPSGAAGCQFPTGTVPWTSIGIRRDDAYDAWGRRIFYRVYTGSAGSLTQAGGASMTDCDTVEAFPAGVTAGAGGLGGLCRSTHDTTPAQFVAGKGLTVTDFGTVHSDVAYVLLSPGVTGLGGYTASGAQLGAPGSNEEKNNLKATGPFTIEAFSDTNTGATESNHFDDVLVYRKIADLARRANLAARDWPDDILTSVKFDKPTLTAALGSNPSSDTGQASIDFGNLTVRALDSNGAQDVSFLQGGGFQDAIGVVGGGGGTGLVTSGGDALQIDFDSDARQLAFTLDRFNTTGTVQEQVNVTFYEVVNFTATQVAGPITKQSCSTSGNLASYTLDAGVNFNRVELRPVPSTASTTSDFTLAEIRTCIASVTCQTTLAPSGDLCP